MSNLNKLVHTILKMLENNECEDFITKLVTKLETNPSLADKVIKYIPIVLAM